MIKYNKHILSLMVAACATTLSAQNVAEENVVLTQHDETVEMLLGDVPATHRSSATSTVKGERLKKSFTQNVLNTLYGEITGLTVMQGSGEPGNDSPTLTSRGVGTFSASTRSTRNVLVIVDGFENTLENITVDEIENVTLLKDAAATAIYGMKGANGVLVVNTKRGRVAPLQVEFNAQVGVNTPQRMPQFLNAYNYAALYNEACVNSGMAPYYSDAALAAYHEHTDQYLYPDVNWADEILSKTSMQQNYNITFRGGNNVVRYFTMLGTSQNNGFFKGTDKKKDLSSNTGLTRYNMRANIDVNVTNELVAEMRMAASIQDKQGPAGGAWKYYNNIASLQPNAFPVMNPNGSYGGNATFSNPVGDLLETGMNSYDARNIQAQLRLKYDLSAILKGLSIHGGVSFNNYFLGQRNKSKKYPYFSLTQLQDGTLNYNQFSEATSMSIDEGSNSQWRNQAFNAGISLNNVYAEKHAVDFTTEWFNDETVNNTYETTDDGLKDRQFPYRYIGLRGHLGYTFNDRYTADFAYAYQGTDLYARGHRFGFFPAASIGWIASNEAFLEDSKVVTFLKPRVSYGLVGNSAIMGSKRYAYTADYAYTGGYYKGKDQNTSVSGIAEGYVANPDLSWEKEKRFNIGVEATLFNKLDIDIDYFHHKRYDILVDPAGTVSAVYGVKFTSMNLGEVTNKGFEMSMRYEEQFSSKAKFYAQLNAWYAKDKVDYMAEEQRAYDNLVRTGHTIDQGFGLKALGLFKDWDEINSSPTQTFGDYQPGDIKYEDVNGDGQIDGDDVTAIGYNNIPRFTGSLTLGFKYAGFDIETMLYGVTGRTAYLSGNTYWAFQNQYAAPISAVDRWTPETAATAKYPRLSSVAVPNNTQYSSFWQHDGSFLKMRYLEVGYTLPEKLSKKVLTKNIRVFLNGTNLFSLHGMLNMRNADPEGLSGMPAMRTISVGAQLKF